MAINITNIKPKAANGTNGANPTNGANGLPATNTQSGAILADSITITTEGGEGGDGGNGVAVPGANGGNGGNASITVNGNIINGAPATTLTIDLHGNGGAGGMGGTGTVNGQRGNGGSSTVTANGNILQPNKIMTLIEVKARAHAGEGKSKGNATATLNGNIVQNSKLTTAVLLQAQAYTHGLNSVANHGDLTYGTKTATVNGNIVQGNINNVTISAEAFYSNGTANLNGNIIQTNATNTGQVNLLATGNKIVITNNKFQLGLQSLTLTINNNSPYNTTIQNNEFKGTGLNAFTFADYTFPGPHTDTVSINLANQTFIFNGMSNSLIGFNSVTVLGNVSATLTGDGNDNILYGSDGDDVIDGGGGNDIIYGGLGQDTLTGGQGNDELHGNDGNDILDGGDGDDFLYGGAGDDILLVSGGTDVLDGMTDPLGDTASFINATSGVNANNGNAQQDFTAQGLGLVTLLNIQNLIGSNYNDILTGDGVGNYLAGGNGDDRLIGVGGNDILNGDANNDTAVYSGNYGIDYVVAVDNAGNGTVSDIRMGAPDGADTLSSIEFIEFANGVFNTATQTFVPNGPPNTAPTLIAAQTPVLASVLEDAGMPVGAVGTLVSSLVDFAVPPGQVDNVTDPDMGAQLGIALTGTGANGTWYYSTNNGGSWTAVGAVSDATALLLAADANTRLYFQPNANFNGTSNITFRAWDQTSGANGGVGNASINGGSTAFSSAFDTADITVTSVNDAPAGTNGTVATLEDAPYTFLASDFGFTDPNDSPANALLAVRISTLPGAGTLTNNGNPVSAGDFVSVADIVAGFLVFTPAANANGLGYAGFTFQVQDNGGTANGGIDLDQTPNTLTIDVTSVNDAPTGTNGTVATLEDAPYTFLAADFGFTDPNDSPANALLAVRISTLPMAGTLTNNGNPVSAGDFISVADIVAGFLVFTPAANANGNGYAGFTFQVQDNGGTANGGIDLDQTPNTLSIDVTSVNDAPAGTDNTLSTSLNTAYIFTAADFGFTDPNDSPANSLLSVRISSLPLDGTLTNNGNPVSAGDFISLADINAGFLQFTPDLNESGPGYASFTFQVRDNGGTANGGVDLDQTPNTITFDVQGGQNYFGTAGDDNHMGSAFDDVMHVSASTTFDVLNGGGHILGDRLTFDTVINNGINYTLNTMSGVYETAAGFGQTSASNFEHLTGSSLNDVLAGDALTNTIDGSGGDDVLMATAGGDTLIGGANTVVGDTADFSGAATNGVTADLFAGTANGVDFGSVTLSGIENLTGTNFADSLTGDGNNNVLNGGGNDDTLTGGLGNDTLDGGTGIDTAVFSAQPTAGDVSWNGSAFVVTGPDGTDTVTNVEHLDDGAGSKILLVGGGGYATIQDAINASSDGDTILIAPGTYSGAVLVDKEVSIVGLGNPGDVVIQGDFRTANGNFAGLVSDFVKNNGFASGMGTGIKVAANNVTLSNLTVTEWLYGIGTPNDGSTIQGLTLNDVIVAGTVAGFQKEELDTLDGLTINGGEFNDALFGIYLSNGTLAGGDAIDTTILGTSFDTIAWKGIYGETAQGNTLIDGISMNDVGNFGGNISNGPNYQKHGAGIDFNLKYHTYVGDLDITNFTMTNVGNSGGEQYGGIIVKGRDTGSYAGNPADVSGLNVTISDGTIDTTKVGIRAGEVNVNPANNVTGPAVTIDGVTVTNASQGEIANNTQSLMTVNGTSGDDVYSSIQTPGANGPIVMYGLGGSDYLLGGTGNDVLVGGEGDDTLDGGSDGIDQANYSDATEDGLVVDLTLGTSSGGGLGNDTLYNIEQLFGSIYNDTLVGDAGDNILSGDDGNDVLYGHGASGANLLLGGNGTDVAYYAGLETDYVGPSIFGVSGGPEAVNDILVDVERIKFLSPSHVSDTDSNGQGNLIFRNIVSGDLEIRESPASLTSVGGIGGNNWRVVGTGQFDPDLDRTADILLQDTLTGNLKVLTEVGGANTQTALSTQPGSAQWTVVGTGDFNGDAASDILLRNTATQATEIMFLNTESTDAVGTVADTVTLTSPGANWRAMGAGDFNGDGKSDVLWQNTATKQVQVHLMNGSTVTNSPLTQAAAGLTAVGTGDFNGDGNSDVLFKNVAGQAVLWFMYGDIHTGTKTIGKPGAMAALGVSGALDVDGNGYSDVIWNDPATGNTRATLLGGPASLVNTTVLNSNFAMPNSASPSFQLVASTGGG